MKIKRLFEFDVRIELSEKPYYIYDFNIKVSAEDNESAEKLCRSYFENEYFKVGEKHFNFSCKLKDDTDKYITED